MEKQSTAVAEKVELSLGELLTTKQVAQILGWHPVTLSKQRREGRGITYRKLGKRVVYLKRDVEEYILNNCVKVA